MNGPFSMLMLLFLLLPASATERLAVLELVGDVPTKELAVLTDTVRGAVVETLGPDIKVMTKENMEVMLTDMGLDASCVSEGACEVETARNLGVDYVVSGTVTQIGGVLVSSMKLHETATGSLMLTQQVQGGDVLALMKALAAPSQALVSKLTVRPSAPREAPKAPRTKVEQDQLACEQGDGAGCARAGRAFMAGGEIEMDLSHATSLAERGCTLGDAAACGMLGGLYWQGWGVQQDLNTARRWFAQACAMGKEVYCGEWADPQAKPTRRSDVKAFLRSMSASIEATRGKISANQGCLTPKRIETATLLLDGIGWSLDAKTVDHAWEFKRRLDHQITLIDAAIADCQ